MFFTASKIFWFVAEPVSLAIFAGILGIFLSFTRFVHAAAGYSWPAQSSRLPFGLLTPIGAVLLRPWRTVSRNRPADMPSPAGIIVLGGAVETAKSEARGQVYWTPRPPG